jgi:hypothetical protein
MSDRGLYAEVGIGATDELRLRVSVASLVRVLLNHPQDNRTILALERRATLREDRPERAVEIKSQPFGGAIRIHDLDPLQNLIGDFHFDSEESRSEQDFRLFIRPSAWEIVRQFCLQHLNDASSLVLESDPQRELTEEFAEAIGIHLQSDQYTYRIIGTVVENDPSPTDNSYARNFPTVRIYRIFESRILDASLANELVLRSEGCSDNDLQKRAFEDARNGGKGWASTSLILPWQDITAYYEKALPETLNRPVVFGTHQLDETVAAILGHVRVPKYKRLVL